MVAVKLPTRTSVLSEGSLMGKGSLAGLSTTLSHNMAAEQSKEALRVKVTVFF